MSKIYVDEIAGIASPSTVAIPGHVIQVVELDSWVEQNFTSSSWVDGPSFSITPKSTSSKIIVVFNFHSRLKGSANAELRGGFRILRDSTAIGNSIGSVETYHTGMGNSIENDRMLMMSQIDSPSTTSAVTYKIQGNLNAGTNLYIFPNTFGGSMYAMEIAG